jgi:hypothetical protein
MLLWNTFIHSIVCKVGVECSFIRYFSATRSRQCCSDVLCTQWLHDDVDVAKRQRITLVEIVAPPSARGRPKAIHVYSHHVNPVKR